MRSLALFCLMLLAHVNVEIFAWQAGCWGQRVNLQHLNWLDCLSLAVILSGRRLCCLFLHQFEHVYGLLVRLMIGRVVGFGR